MKKRKNISEEKKEENLKKKTLKLSIKEGSFASLMSGFGTNYIAPFALALNASNLQIGLLSSFVGLISPFSQLYGSRIMEKNSRKKIIFKFVLLQALMWLPIISLIFFFWKNIGTPYLSWALIIFYLMLSLFGSIASPAWFSLMGDLVPENRRGRYFSTRNKINGTVLLVSTLIASFLIDYFKTKGWILIGFLIIFSLAMFGRLISAQLFKKHHEPKLIANGKYYFSFFDFLKKGIKNNFGKFSIFVGIMYFSVMIASPFFTVYMLKDLAYDYKTFILVTMSTTVYSIIFISVLGKIADKHGNRFLLKIGSGMISISPLLWFVSKNPYYLIFVPQLIGGIGWAAFNLSAGNFIYDSVTPIKRGLCITYHNILIGVGTFIGAILGGFLTQNIFLTFINTFIFVFFLSGILRILTSLIFIPKIKEVRKLKTKPQFTISMLNPLTEITHDLIGIKRKFGKLGNSIQTNLEDQLVNWIYEN